MRLLRALPVLCLSLFLTRAPEAAERADAGAAAPTAAPLTRGGHGEVLVPVELNGQGPFLAMVDTGATHTSLSRDLAVRLGLPVVARAEVRTSAGSVMQPVAELARLMLAGVSDTSLLVSLVEPERLDPLRRIVVSIGQDVLASRPFSLDFAGRRFSWGLEAAGPGATSVKLEPMGGRFVATLPQGGSALRLVVDTGSETLVLYEGSGLPRMQPASAPVLWLETVAGRRLVQPMVVHTLQAGGLTLRQLPAVTLPKPAGIVDVVDGLLPLSFFARVVVDGPGRRLTLAR